MKTSKTDKKHDPGRKLWYSRHIVGYSVIVGLIYENFCVARRVKVFCVVPIQRIAGDDGVVCQKYDSMPALPLS